MRSNHPELTVHYTTAERFTCEFVTALRTHGPERFKQRYRGLDALLIDDVQFLEGKEKTEEEFVHTFNALFAAGKQIVMSSDRPPGSLVALEERLRDRFEWGLDGRARPARPAHARRRALALRLRRDRPAARARRPARDREPRARATSGGSRARSPASSPSPPSTTSRSPRARSSQRSARAAAEPAGVRRHRDRAERRRDPGRGRLRRRHLARRPPLRQAHAGTSCGRATSRCSSPASSRRSPSFRSPATSTATTPPSSTPSARSTSETSPAPRPPEISTASVHCLGRDARSPGPEDGDANTPGSRPQD